VPREVAKYTLADRRRLAVTPGITCLWQISGRAEIDFPGQVKLDVRYIESRSLGQDLKILLKTIPAVLSGTGAY
jgi:lipopolysaccharide/colanic/teichoic acid biosynthesis glycosyltransferase